MLKLTSLAVAMLCAGLLLAAPAHAQLSPDLIMETYNSNIQVVTDGAINKATMRGMTSDKNGTSTRSTTKTSTTRSAAAARLTYTTTPDLRQRTVQRYVARLRPQSPAGAQAIATAFGPGKQDYGQVYAGIIAGENLHDNNAADAMTTLFAIGYMIVHNLRDDKDISSAMVQGLQAQCAPLLAQNAQLAQPGVAARMGEEMKLQTVILQGGWQTAIKQNTVPAFQQSIAGLFRNQYGLNLSQMRLTSSGLVAR